jgi:hypothetical protein
MERAKCMSVQNVDLNYAKSQINHVTNLSNSKHIKKDKAEKSKRRYARNRSSRSGAYQLAVGDMQRVALAALGNEFTTDNSQRRFLLMANTAAKQIGEMKGRSGFCAPKLVPSFDLLRRVKRNIHKSTKHCAVMELEDVMTSVLHNTYIKWF